MPNTFSQLATGAGLIACIACNHAPASPQPGGPPSNSPIVYSSPPIRGLLRETNGGPIAGVLVGLRTTVGTFVRSEKVASDAAGVFVLPSSTDMCPGAGTVAVEISERDFMFQNLQTIPCSTVSNPPEISLEVKGQRYITVTSAAPVVIPLSNDDLNWVTDENGYSCGPCRFVAFPYPVHAPMDVHVEWSGPVPIHLWVEGDRGYGDLVRLREVIPRAGETTMKASILPEWRDLYIGLKVGLPFGGRFPANSPPISVRIEVVPR